MLGKIKLTLVSNSSENYGKSLRTLIWSMVRLLPTLVLKTHFLKVPLLKTFLRHSLTRKKLK